MAEKWIFDEFCESMYQNIEPILKLEKIPSHRLQTQPIFDHVLSVELRSGHFKANAHQQNIGPFS